MAIHGGHSFHARLGACGTIGSLIEVRARAHNSKNPTQCIDSKQEQHTRAVMRGEGFCVGMDTPRAC